MNIKKILFVFGTRPEAIKMAPLIHEFLKFPEKFKTIVCITAQHREMLDSVLSIFDITPDYDLNIMQSGQDLTDITSRVLIGMKEVLSTTKPDLVLVHGDTTTSTATALAAYYQQIAVGHIEAGLRTHNIYSPWPEEINRQLTGRIAKWHFAPTILSQKNLLNEGVSDSSILVTGNTVIDALHLAIKKINNTPYKIKEIENELIENGIPITLINNWNGNKSERRMVLITGHRRENFGEGFINICEAIRDLSLKYPVVDFVYPMHLNPNVRKPILDVFGDINKDNFNTKNVYFIEPLQYLPFVFLMQKSVIILTDSGGIQEEAPGLGIPVLVMRDTTERPEAVEAGTVKLTGTKKEKIIEEVSLLIDDNNSYIKMTQANNPYGDGRASERIVDFIINLN